MHKAQRLINHVALVLDASWSMSGRERAVVKATDEQIKHLALRSEELSQETRVSVYRFGDATIECLIFDMDVMRLPSADDLYEVLYENTALIDATMKSQSDLATTSQLYGDHAFLTFVLTDGQENRSKRYSAADLRRHIMNSSSNWSLGFLVPDNRGVAYMENLGVLRDSIAIWDAESSAGLNTAVSAIKTATDNFMTARATGVRGTRSVFSTGADAINPKTVRSNLRPLDRSTYRTFTSNGKYEIRDFVESVTMRQYVKGNSYYQLEKSEKIQPTKKILVVDKSNGTTYAGDAARDLIGLPSNREVRVHPDDNPKYDVFVQSTSFNRHVLPGTKVLVLS
jgi:hypothetical protein